MKAHAPKSDAGIAGGDGMGGRCVLAVDADGRAALERLGRSGVRGEADRARAVLWSLDGETSAATAAPAGRAGGAGAALACRVPGRRGRGAAVASAAGAARHASGRRRSPSPATSCGGAPPPTGRCGRWPGPAAEVAAQSASSSISSGHLSVALRKGATAGAGRGTRSRDARTGTRSSASALRLRLLKQQAAAGDIHLLFGDEAEALTHPYLAHCWAERGADLRVEAPVRAKKRALLGVLDHARGELVVITSGTKRSGDFADLLARLDRELRAARRAGRAGRWCWRSTTARSTRARRAGGRSPRGPGSRSSGSEVRAGAERHRALLARPEAPLPGPPHLPRRRPARPRHPPRRPRPQHRASRSRVRLHLQSCLARTRADCTTVDGPGAAVGGWDRFDPDRRRAMPRAYSTDLRERALAAYEAGEGRQSEIARAYRIGERTLSGWLKTAREEGRRPEAAPRGPGAGRRRARRRWPGWWRSGTTPPWPSTPTCWPSAPGSGAAPRPCAGR